MPFNAIVMIIINCVSDISCCCCFVGLAGAASVVGVTVLHHRLEITVPVAWALNTNS